MEIRRHFLQGVTLFNQTWKYLQWINYVTEFLLIKVVVELGKSPKISFYNLEGKTGKRVQILK